MKDSRFLYKYMDNGYMVCVGYSDLLCNLGRRVGLNICEISCRMDVESEKAAHKRNYINLKDPKYGIDGMYVLDATTDGRGFLCYDCFLITTEKGREEVRTDLKEFPYDRLFTTKNAEEFKQEWESMSEINRYRYKDRLEMLDKDFFSNFSIDMQNNDVYSIINYFDKKINNEIEPDKIIKAIIHVKKETFKNLSEQDAKDFEMMYLRCFFNQNNNEQREYLLSRYNDVESLSTETVLKKYPFFNVNKVLFEKLNSEYKGMIPKFDMFANEIRIIDRKLLELFKANEENLKDTQFRLVEKTIPTRQDEEGKTINSEKVYYAKYLGNLEEQMNANRRFKKS